MKLFQLLPKKLHGFAYNQPGDVAGGGMRDVVARS